MKFGTPVLNITFIMSKIKVKNKNFEYRLTDKLNLVHLY